MMTRKQYDPQLILKYQLGILSKQEAELIPSSTMRNWKYFDLGKIQGYNSRATQDDVISLKKEYKYDRLKKGGVAMYFIHKAIIEAVKERPEIYDDYNLRKQLLAIIDKFSGDIPKKKLFIWAGIKPQQFHAWKRRTCKVSVREICRLRHPSQLTIGEVKTIDSYLKQLLPKFKTKSAVYAQMIRDGKALMAEKTFYNYSRLLGYVSHRLRKRKRPNGIRADSPKQILHMDVTQYKFGDNTKAYIYLIQDNFSRKILGWEISRSCNSAIVKANLQEVCNRYHLKDQERVELIVDGGIENKGEVMEYLKMHANIKLRIALKDIVQSNSMIEAANRCLKHYHIFFKNSRAGKAHASDY